MKKKWLLSLLVAASALHAADDKEKGLPPGLQKKDKLPPGIAKKQTGGTTAATNVIVPDAPAAPVAKTPGAPASPAPAPAPAPARGTKVDLGKRAQAVNNLDDREGVRRAGIAAIATETGADLSTVQRQHREHEKLGTAGLFFANAIAAKTGKPPGTYIRQHADGKSWEKIAEDNKVSFEELDAKLARVEAAMRSAK